MKRMWINQPSTLDPLHKMHGTNVLTADEETVYPVSGETISLMVPRRALSSGWRDTTPALCECRNCEAAR